MTGCILAGGRSSRMGCDKAWLPLGSETLIERVIRRLRPWVERVAVIGHVRNVERLRVLPVDDVWCDLAPDRGPLMGVFTGLMRSQTDVNVFISCDMPYVDERLIDQLAGSCTDATPLVASLHPVEGVQPFPLVCHVKACLGVGALLDRGERSLRGLLAQYRASLVRIDEPQLWRSFTNVNTAEDYARLREELSTPLSRALEDR